MELAYVERSGILANSLKPLEIDSEMDEIGPNYF
jgi:hypothetical protein